MTLSSAPLVFATEPFSLDDLGPERIHHFYEPRSGLRAAVVIDSTRFSVNGGGVRMAPDVSLREVARLARAMSLKYALLDIPVGGAKAGIWFDPGDPHRGEIVAAFLRVLRPLIESGAFVPGADMGTVPSDFDALYGGPDAALASERERRERVENLLTGYGVAVAAARARERLGGKLDGARVAIEGFGKVGGAAAHFFVREGARVVALSTVRCALHDPAGLDVEVLLALRERHGDGALEAYGRGARLPRDALFGLPADVLVPGARPDAISPANVDAVCATLVVPAANIPYADGTVARLAARGVTAVPDFVANAGGAAGVVAVLQGATDEEALAHVRERIDANVARVFDAARAQGRAPYDVAVDLAREALLRA